MAFFVFELTPPGRAASRASRQSLQGRVSSADSLRSGLLGEGGSGPDQGPASTAESVALAWKGMRGLGLCVGFNFFVTLSVFPAVTTQVVPYSNWFGSPARWVSIYGFLAFNTGDFLGRQLVGLYTPKSTWTIALLVLLRAAFVPLFLLCNVKDSQHAVLFKHDAWPLGLMAAMAVSNGYMGTVCMMKGPAACDARAREMGGTLMAFCLCIGLVLGGTFSFAVINFSTGVDAIKCGSGSNSTIH